MKKIEVFIFILCILLCCNIYGQSIAGNGNVIEKERKINDFSKIKVTDGIDLNISQGTDIKLIVIADENLHDFIKTEVINEYLKIFIDGNIRNTKALEINLTIKVIDYLSAEDGSDVNTKTVLNLDELTVNCSDGSDLKLELNAKQLDCELSDGSDAEIEGIITYIQLKASEGSDIEGIITSDVISCEINEGSDVKLEGTARSFSVNAFEGSDLDASGFKVENCTLKIYEGVDASVYVTNSFIATAESGSDIIYKGNPINKDIKLGEDCDAIGK